MSMSRRCDIQLADDGRWYMTLGNFEYAYDDCDCTTYGPFTSRDALEKELDRHSNPGSLCVDESGKYPPPKVTAKPRGTVRLPGYITGRYW